VGSPDIRPWTLSPHVAPLMTQGGRVVPEWRSWSFPGAYAIATPNGHVYVGSSKNIAGRLSGHARMLRHGKHHNRFLTNYVGVHGLEGLTVAVLARSDGDARADLERLEQSCIDGFPTVVNASRRAVVPPAHFIGVAARAQLSAARRTAWKTSEYRDRVTAAVREVRDVIALRSRERWTDPEYRAKVIESFRLAQADEGLRAVHSRAASLLWEKWANGADPHKTTEFRANQSERIRKLWSDPEWRARTSAAISLAGRSRRGEKRPAQSAALLARSAAKKMVTE
jgi:hypothetical protein